MRLLCLDDGEAREGGEDTEEEGGARDRAMEDWGGSEGGRWCRWCWRWVWRCCWCPAEKVWMPADPQAAEVLMTSGGGDLDEASDGVGGAVGGGGGENWRDTELAGDEFVGDASEGRSCCCCCCCCLSTGTAVGGMGGGNAN